jgi:anti-sigma regulatory factor (Ser/Thr protein kinase)
VPDRNPGYVALVTEHCWALPHTVDAPAMTRELIARACENGCVPEARAADCSLMATELVTNALLHGRGDITLTVGCRESGAVRVEVRDAGSSDWGGTLHPAHADSDRETGRGLRIIEALAEDWGVEAGDAATCAWFEVSRPPDG